MIDKYKYIQLDYLDTIAGEDRNLRHTLLEMVREELTSAIPGMNQALAGQDWEALHEIVHKLKSTLAFIGNPVLTEINQLILSHLENKEYEADFNGWLSKYNHLSGPIKKELQQELSN